MTSCAAQGNGADGIVTLDSSTISGCTTSGNTGHGIEVRDECRVADNNCASNVVMGINVTGNRNRIIGNLCGQNNVDGIRIQGGTGNHVEGNTLVHSSGINGAIVLAGGATGNLIVKNTARGTVYVLPAGNSVGAILNVAGLTITTTNPWRNFEY